MTKLWNATPAGEPPGPTARTELRRHPERGSHDRAVIDAILDEAPICHVGFAGPGGQPYVVPTIHARVGDVLYLHGSPASRALRTLGAGVPACVTATILDGLVLARSAFNHSMNYRSVMVLGTMTPVEDPAEKDAAFRAIVEHVAAGRSLEARMPSPEESRKTLVVRIPVEEASAKLRTGPPKDDPEDMALPVWAGVLPLRLVALAPEPDPSLDLPLPVPPSVLGYGPARGSVGG